MQVHTARERRREIKFNYENGDSRINADLKRWDTDRSRLLRYARNDSSLCGLSFPCLTRESASARDCRVMPDNDKKVRIATMRKNSSASNHNLSEFVCI